MDTTTLSSKFQVVIPKRVRESLGLKAGERFGVLRVGDRIELIPMRKLPALRGFLKGMDTRLDRDPDRI